MKQLLLILSLMIAFYGNITAQKELRFASIQQKWTLQANDSQFIILGPNGSRDVFHISKKPTDRHFALEDENAKIMIDNILKLDKDEAKLRFDGPFRNLDPIDQLVNYTAATPEPIVLIPDSSLRPAPEEAGGQIPQDRNEDTATTNWLGIIVALAAGFILGAIVMSMGRKKTPAVSPTPTAESVKDFETEIAAVKNDPGKVTQAAKQKLAKLEEAKKTLTAELKQLKTEYKTLAEKQAVQSKFYKDYFNQANKEVIAPANDALAKGNHAEAAEELVRMAAHFTSIARHELGMKQAYDTVNIGTLLRHPLPQNKSVEQADGSTAPDMLPANIRNVRAFLQHNGGGSTRDAVIFGYRLSK